MQDDVIFAYFTVKEALTFAARLRLKISEAEQDVKINTLIRDLGLEKCKDTIVGSIKKKTISGGERKRTAIGVELITDPSMILLDEPTSGLDSFMAKSICKLLQKLAHKQGKTIISTIHQPSSQAFAYFDRLLLMADGYTVYQGLAKNSPVYFNSLGFSASTFSNPADVFMKVLSLNYPKGEDDEAKIEMLVSNYTKVQADAVVQEMNEFTVPQIDFAQVKKQEASFAI